MDERTNGHKSDWNFQCEKGQIENTRSWFALLLQLGRSVGRYCVNCYSRLRVRKIVLARFFHSTSLVCDMNQPFPFSICWYMTIETGVGHRSLFHQQHCQWKSGRDPFFIEAFPHRHWDHSASFVLSAGLTTTPKAIEQTRRWRSIVGSYCCCCYSALRGWMDRQTEWKERDGQSTHAHVCSFCQISRLDLQWIQYPN